MKKSLLSMAALALIMASCSNDEENVIDNGEAANAVPVQISQKVAGVETKAAVVPGVSMQAVILMADGESPDFTSFTPRKENTLDNENKFAGDGDRANIANAEFTASGTAGEITLTPALYYPVSAKTRYCRCDQSLICYNRWFSGCDVCRKSSCRISTNAHRWRDCFRF